MRRAIVVVALAALARAAAAEQVLDEFTWSQPGPKGRLAEGTAAPPHDAKAFDSLIIDGSAGQARAFTVLTVDAPAITLNTYALRGQVRCEGVEGRGYLEMWSYFPGGAHYFSRALASTGPMAALEGTSDWRPFVLPFFLKDHPMRPEKLVVNVVLPGRGKVELGPLRLAQYAGSEDPLAAPSRGWWTDRTGGWIGGVFGGLFGLLGGLTGYLSARGKARGFVLGAMKATAGVGVAALAVGVVALASRQPYGVWYPPLLVGVLLTILPLALLKAARRRYEQLELRRMTALDTS